MKVWQWQELNKPIEEGFFSRMIRFVSILTETPEDEVETLPTKELIKQFKSIQHLGQVHDNNKDVIDLGIDLRLIPFEQLTLGQFIDCEILVSDGFHKNFCKLIATIYLHSKGGDLYELEYEPFSKVNVKGRALLIEDLEINDVLGSGNKYLKWRESFFQSYDIFQDPLEGVDEDGATPEELQIIKEEKAKIEKDKESQWMNIVNVLAGSDLTKFETVLNQNVYLAFNQLTYLNAQTKPPVPTL